MICSIQQLILLAGLQLVLIQISRLVLQAFPGEFSSSFPGLHRLSLGNSPDFPWGILMLFSQDFTLAVWGCVHASQG